MVDTIYALSTAPGKAGVAIIRISGPESKAVLEKLSVKPKPLPRTAQFSSFFHPDSKILLDKGLFIYFSAPHSFTGEDVVELHIHGGKATISSFYEFLGSCRNVRLAEPGEFTKRSFENGKVDLTEAEAVADLINAETELQRQQALSQLNGSLSELYSSWSELLKQILAHLEADLEFPDEDLPDGMWPKIKTQVENIFEQIQSHLNDGRRGEILREGVKVAIVGAPNVGKSTLLNSLARRDVAIVSEYAGTTRDVIECHLDIKGIPVTFYDTAGLRAEELGADSHDEIEKEGIRRALLKAKEADFKMIVFDGSTLPDLDQNSLSMIDADSICVINKLDLVDDTNLEAINGKMPICISAKKEKNLDQLIQTLVERVNLYEKNRDGPYLTRNRHRIYLEECNSHITNAISQDIPELRAEDIRQAMRALGKITGHVDVEDLLDVIFKDFCIGK